MSWNKNTTTSTKIDNTIEVLRENDISYTLEILGKVQARGLNDSYTGTEYYVIRKLSYQNFVIIERMLRDSDCDVDDCIIATKFNKNDVPENWELEIEEKIEEDTEELIDDCRGEMSGNREDLMCPRCRAPQNEIQETDDFGYEWKCGNCGTKFKIENTYKVTEINGEIL